MVEIKTEKIVELLEYDEQTGELYWKHRPEFMFRDTAKRSAKHCAANWNSKHAGKIAFTAIGSHGYRTGTINGKRFLLHRVAYFLKTGSWPPMEVDHINGNRLDNRWVNLRCSSKAQNNRNARGYSKTSNYIGVSWNKSLNGYVAKVYHNGKSYYCGFSKDNPDLLARKRDQKARELFGEFARLNFEEETQ